MVDYGYNENRSGYSGRSSTYTQAVSSNADRSGKYIYLINSLYNINTLLATSFTWSHFFVMFHRLLWITYLLAFSVCL